MSTSDRSSCALRPAVAIGHHLEHDRQAREHHRRLGRGPPGARQEAAGVRRYYAPSISSSRTAPIRAGDAGIAVAEAARGHPVERPHRGGRLYYQTPTIRPPPHARKIIHPTVASKPTAITNFVPNRTAALRAAVPDELPVRSTPLITRPRARLDYGKAGIALHPS